MSHFERLFGIKAAKIKKNCILLPQVPPGLLKKLKIERLSRAIFCSASDSNFSVIVSGIGSALIGDAVLYLKETACQRIILFGSCGLVKEKPGLSIGNLVTPVKSYSYESFSSLLLEKDKKPKSFAADSSLLRRLYGFGSEVLQKVVCATVSSLKLEEKMQDQFSRYKIDVVDMESSAFFCAAKFCGIEAAALFYATDIINKKPFYRSLTSFAQTQLNETIENAVWLLNAFLQV